jgi:hypothetical protein
MASHKDLPLWRVVGTGKRGGNCSCKVRAATHSDALTRAAGYGCVNVTDCVMIEELGARGKDLGSWFAEQVHEGSSAADALRSIAVRVRRLLTVWDDLDMRSEREAIAQEIEAIAALRQQGGES